MDNLGGNIGIALFTIVLLYALVVVGKAWYIPGLSEIADVLG